MINSSKNIYSHFNHSQYTRHMRVENLHTCKTLLRPSVLAALLEFAPVKIMRYSTHSTNYRSLSVPVSLSMSLPLSLSFILSLYPSLSPPLPPRLYPSLSASPSLLPLHPHSHCNLTPRTINTVHGARFHPGLFQLRIFLNAKSQNLLPP